LDELPYSPGKPDFDKIFGKPCPRTLPPTAISVDKGL